MSSAGIYLNLGEMPHLEKDPVSRHKGEIGFGKVLVAGQELGLLLLYLWSSKLLATTSSTILSNASLL